MFGKRKAGTVRNLKHRKVSQDSANPLSTLIKRNKGAVTLSGPLRTLTKHETLDIARNRGSLDARKFSRTVGVRGTTKAILLTGGLEVVKQDFLLVKEQGFTSSWKKRLIIFEQGLMKFFDPALLQNYNPKEKLDDYVERVLNIVELRDIVYDDRKGKQFGLSFRPNAGTASGMSDSERKVSEEQMRKDSKRSTGSSTSSITQMFRNSLSPLGRKAEEVLYFKSSCPEDTDDWVQSILYEVRNQAMFIDKTIRMLQQKSANEVDQIDCLFRQSVDLWVLAKGKVSREALEAVRQFSMFLDACVSPEATYWEDVIRKIEPLVAVREKNHGKILNGKKKAKKMTGLEQLQMLNDEEYHQIGDQGTFVPTSKDYKESAVKKVSSKRSKEVVAPMPKLPHAVKVEDEFILIGEDAEGDDDELMDFNQMLSCNGSFDAEVEQRVQARKAETKKTKSKPVTNSLDFAFKSAVDMRQERETEEERAALQQLELSGVAIGKKTNQLNL